MTAVTYAVSTFQEVTVERVTTGQGAKEDTNDTHLIQYKVTNIHPTAVIRGWVEINNVVDRDSGPLQPGEVWTADYALPGLALGGGTRVGWGIQEV